MWDVFGHGNLEKNRISMADENEAKKKNPRMFNRSDVLEIAFFSTLFRTIWKVWGRNYEAY